MQSIHEKIYRIWCQRKQGSIGIRILYSSMEQDGCRIFTMLRREEWD